MASDSGIKDNAKGEHTGWLVVTFTSERVFAGWFPGSLFFFARENLDNSRSRLANSRSTLINSRSRLAKDLSSTFLRRLQGTLLHQKISPPVL